MTIDLQRTLATLREKHLDGPHRRTQTAIDVPAAVWLWNACEREHAQRVLDLGSGFSSWTIRHWQQRAEHDRETAPAVWTIDDESKWLEATRLELEALGLSTDQLTDFDTLCQIAPTDYFDVVFVDLGNTRIRRRHAADFVRWTRPGGLLVLDDWHMLHYREPMTDLLLALGVVVKPVAETMDQWGRYLAVGRKPA